MEILAHSPDRPEVSRMSCLTSFEQRRNSGVPGKGAYQNRLAETKLQPWQGHGQGGNPKAHLASLPWSDVTLGVVIRDLWQKGEEKPMTLLSVMVRPSLFPSTGMPRGQYHTVQAGFSSRSQGLSGDKTSVSQGVSSESTLRGRLHREGWELWIRRGGSQVNPRYPFSVPSPPIDLPAHRQASLQPSLLVLPLSCGPELQSEAELCPQWGQCLWGCGIWGCPAHSTYAHPASVLP